MITQEATAFVVGQGAMRKAFERMRRVAALDTTVLLQGESGTGKELAARYLHDSHPRRAGGPLICVHCGGIPESLLESELFGHERGAFTGADRDRVGKFEQANGGTLLLDEISTMSPEAQVRLLRVLQDRTVTRVGSAEPRRVNVRVVVATNQDLFQLIEEGRFREDLYYRVSTYPVRLPSLRDRVEDLVELIECLAHRVGERIGLREPKGFSAEAIRHLASYDWPGNVRELENVIEFASIEAEDRTTVQRHDLPPHVAGLDPMRRNPYPGLVVTEDGLSLRTAVTNLERELILQSLRLSEGNKARAAELLDLKRTTFLEKLRRLEQEDCPADSPNEPEDLDDEPQVA